MVCGELLALSATCSVPARLPVAPGLNVTLIVHVDFAATLPTQLSVSLKSPGFAPPNEIPATVSAVARLLVSVTAFDPLGVPTF
jgi:hypothetical protein